MDSRVWRRYYDIFVDQNEVFLEGSFAEKWRTFYGERVEYTKMRVAPNVRFCVDSRVERIV